MQDADDFDARAGLAVEDHMPSHMIFTIPLPNIVTGTAPARLARQEMKGLIQPGKIAVSLVPAPCLLGVPANVLQIGPGFRGEAEGGH
jgi:hypothetical protein